ncbi:MAG: hypothetical protein AB7P00_34060, partial [Sandaracinaceae bacterium]
VTVEEGGAIAECPDMRCVAEISRGEFSLDFPVTTVTALTRVQAEITGAPALRVGASPFFGFNEGLGEGVTVNDLAIRIPMLTPGACTSLDAPNVSVTGLPLLAAPRRDAGVAVRRNIALVVGGIEATGPSGRVDRYDQAVTEVPLELAPVEAMGPTRGVALDEDNSLFVGQVALHFVPGDGMDGSGAGPPEAEVFGVHPGASARSALIAISGTQAAVVGGVGSDGVTWVTLDGALAIVTAVHALAEVREDPAVARVGNGALVVGGAPDRALGAELIVPGSDGAPVAVEGTLPAGSGGWLIPSPDSRTLLWIGRVERDGAGGLVAPTDTVLLSGCPTACTASAGPTWDRARTGAASVRTLAGDQWLVGGDGPLGVANDRVRWSGSTPRIEPAPDLVHARSGASVVEHGSGIIAVLGGESEDGLRADVELCLPDPGLDPF